MSKSLFLIDYSIYAYKFKSAFRFARTDINGISVDISVLVGFIRSIKANLADNIVIVLDGVPQRTNMMLGSYKGQRSKEGDELVVQAPIQEIVKFLTKIGEYYNRDIKVVASPCQETDEVISSITHAVTGNLPKNYEFISKLNQRSIDSDELLKSFKDGVELVQYRPSGFDSVVISSTDGDFIQLQRFDNVYIDTSTSGKSISSTRTSKSTAEVNPAAAVLYKSIFGDMSDNIAPISKSIPKSDKLLSLIAEIKNDEDVKEFKEEFDKGTGKRFKTLLAVVNPYRKQFQLNWDATFLKFLSFPYRLTYKDYNIEDTINKYKLRM